MMVICVFEVCTYTVAKVTVVADSVDKAKETLTEWFDKNHLVHITPEFHQEYLDKITLISTKEFAVNSVVHVDERYDIE